MRVTMAWELGGGGGHVGRLGVLGHALRSRGHRVDLLCRDPQLGHRWSGPGSFDRVIQAPTRPKPTDRPTVATWADILLHACYHGSASDCHAYIEAWANALEACRPDVLVTDFAPTAVLLAGRLDAPCINVSTGYDMPPAGRDSLPNLRALAGFADADTFDTTIGERRLLEKLADRLPSGTQRLTDLYAGMNRIRTTVPALDHYGPQPDGRYVGRLPVPPVPTADTDWPAGNGLRLAGYVKPFAMLGLLLDLLGLTGIASLLHLTRINARNTQPNVTVTAEPLPLDVLARDADIGVCHAGAATVATFARAGVPMLLIPLNTEQAITARRVAELGIGIAVGPEDAEGLRGGLQRLLADGRFTASAKTFAATLGGFDLDAALCTTVDAIESLSCSSRHSET